MLNIDLNCPLCKSKDVRFVASVPDVEYETSSKKYSYFKCTNCGCVFLKNPPVDQLQSIYPATYYSFANKRHAGVAQILSLVKSNLESRFFKRLIQNHLQGVKSVEVLDVGGGTGFICDVLGRHINCDTRFTVLDLDQAALEIAQQKGYSTIHGSIEEVSIQSKFDLIIALNLIEHVGNPAAVIRKFRGALRENGVIVIKTPNTDSINYKIFKKIYWGGYHAPRHFVLFNERNFRTLVSAEGLSVFSLKYTQGAPQWTYSVLGAVKLNWFPRLYLHGFFSDILKLAFAAFDFLRLSLGARTDQMWVLLKRKA